MNKKFYALMLLALPFTAFSQARTLNQAKTNGTNWSSTSTWSLGRLPASGDSIVIPSGYTVWLDISASLNNVYINIGGTLEVDKNSVLTLDIASAIMIQSGGLLSTTHPSATEIITIGGVKKYSGNTDVTISGFGYASGSTGTSPAGFSSTPMTLPVTYVSFTAVRNAGDVTLDWTTATETNNSHFEVERSLDGSDWTTIGTVAAGTGARENSYHFTDAMASGTEIWYRLRQVDLDGQAQCSHIVLVAGATTAKTTVVATGKTINVLFAQPVSGPVTARLIALNGQVLQQETFEQAAGTLSLGASRVPNGVYVVYLSDGKGWSMARKILL
ncbi:MAG: hypothetical protein JST42_11805 [Bacteroidetes bacterium]|nr:hypothetical protein [Bacteroidota bacterium]